MRQLDRTFPRSLRSLTSIFFRAGLVVAGLALVMADLNVALALVESETPVPVPVELKSGELPAASRINDMPLFAQQRTLSCEYAAARTAAALWGVRLSEEDFIEAIPTDPNPHLGFRGDIDGTWGGTEDYGIYPEPLALFLASKGLNTKLLWDGADSLKEEISLGRPVVVWIVESSARSQPVEESKAGQAFWLLPYEHSVVVYGYDQAGVLVADPGFGTYEYYSWAFFLSRWSYLGNMAMSVWPASQVSVAQSTGTERSGIASQFYRYWLHGYGLELMGQPIGPSFETGGKVFQYFERARLEYDKMLPPGQAITRGLLGREVTAGRISEGPFQPLNSTEISGLNSEEKPRFFPETNFFVGAAFNGFWQERGGLGAFGFPISRPFYEEGHLVQYFERVRMELHEEETAFPDGVIRLGLLGRERLLIKS